jgi:hypothetical protein
MTEINGTVPAELAAVQANLGIAATGLYNWKSTNTVKIRKAIADTLAGLASTRIIEIGDSTTAGVADVPAGAGAALWNLSPPALLSRAIQAMLNNSLVGVPQSSFGDMGFTDYSYLGTYDTRVVRGAGWVAGALTLGGAGPANTTTTNAITYTFPNCDTFDLYYIRNGGFGTFNYNVDGGSNTLINADSGGGNSIAKITIAAGSLGSHTLSIARASGTVYLVGVESRNSAIQGVSVWNMGSSGKTSDYFTTTANSWGALTALKGFAPNLTIINLGINDRRDPNGPVPLATTIANLQTIITGAKISGDVLLLDPAASDATAAPLDRQATMSAALRALAFTNDIPFMSVPERFGLYSVANANGLMSDTLHPNSRLNADRARLLANMLLAA